MARKNHSSFVSQSFSIDLGILLTPSLLALISAVYLKQNEERHETSLITPSKRWGRSESMGIEFDNREVKESETKKRLRNVRHVLNSCECDGNHLHHLHRA